MKPEDVECIVSEVGRILSERREMTLAILGAGPVAYQLRSKLRALEPELSVLGMFDIPSNLRTGPTSVRAMAELAKLVPDVVAVASDQEKEDLLDAAGDFLSSGTRIVLAGYGHFEFRDLSFEQLLAEGLVPSLANGYPNTLVHLYQCLRNCARLELSGVVVEFGMFKGGTTAFLARCVRRFGQKWPVIGFDTFDGFPPRRHPFDMYSHPGCIFRDEQSVRNYVGPLGVEVVAGDIVETVKRLKDERIVLAFIDTDNFTSARAILEVISDRVVVGGAIVFDHFTGRNRFLYTIGERMAAKALLADRRYFNLHDSGVFIRQTL